jgi:hypothetical protein
MGVARLLSLGWIEVVFEGDRFHSGQFLLSQNLRGHMQNREKPMSILSHYKT